MKHLLSLCIGIGFVIVIFFQSCEPSAQEKLVTTDNVVSDSLIMGLIVDEGVALVIKNCTPCHSSKLITQNRSTKDGWKSMIRWMQSTQNLWNLGEEEDIVLEYLAKNYAPDKTGRRRTLENIEWYPLEN